MELRGFWCGTEAVGTEEFLVGNRRVLLVELRTLWCGTNGFCELKRSSPFVWN